MTFPCHITSCLRHRFFLNRQAGCLPLGKAVLQPPRLEPQLAELGNGLERQHAVGTAAVGDNLGLGVQLREVPLQLAQRNVARTGDMSERELILRAHVDEGDQTLELSPVLKAMKVAPEAGMGAIRFSLGRGSTQADVDQAVEGLRRSVS
jgi:hypothetical protein